MLIMTLNVTLIIIINVEMATKVEMPAIVDKENDEFRTVVHSNPERSNDMPMHSTLVSDCGIARLADPLCCADVHQQVYAVLRMTEKTCRYE